MTKMRPDIIREIAKALADVDEVEADRMNGERALRAVKRNDTKTAPPNPLCED